MKVINELRKIWNLFLGYTAYNLQITKSINHPIPYGIETTNICNLRCIMCPREVMKRAVGYMDFSVFKKIIDQSKKYARSVSLYFFGEPLLDKNLSRYIEYCKKAGIDTWISTNATILSEEKSKELIKAGLDGILFCIDGFTKETYEKIRNRGDFEKVKNNVLRFLALKKELNSKKPHTTVQIIKMKETEKEIRDFIKFWEKTGVDDVFLKDFCTWANQENGIKELSEQKHRFIKEISNKRPPCYYLWHSLVIYWDGTVVPCCRDTDSKMVVGNVREQSLDEIWHSEKMMEIRKMHVNGNFNLPLCKSCDDYPDVSPSLLLINKKNIKKILYQIRKMYGDKKKKFSYLHN